MIGQVCESFKDVGARACSRWKEENFIFHLLRLAPQSLCGEMSHGNILDNDWQTSGNIERLRFDDEEAETGVGVEEEGAAGDVLDNR